jgi:ankyrin repeat protein
MAATYNPLYAAVLHGQLRDVRHLLAAGGARILRKADAAAPYGGCMLHLAAWQNHGAIASELLYYGAAVGAKDHKGRTPLHIAATCGSTGVIKRLLDYGADIRACDGNGDTPLLLACSSGMMAAASLLLDSGAPVNRLRENQQVLEEGEFENVRSDEYTPLHVACQLGSVEMVRLLLDAGANLSQLCALGCTPLWVACYHDDQEVLAELLWHGADATIPDNDGCSPLHIACQNRCIQVLMRLLQLPEVLKGLDADTNGGATPLYWAAVAGYGDVVSLLVTAGADPHPLVTNELQPLYAAIVQGRTAVAKQLLAAGASMNGHAPDGETFLHTAIACRDLALVKQLLGFGADPGVAAGNGFSSIHAAAAADCTCILARLLDAVAAGKSTAGVDAEVQGKTALHLALELKYWGCVKLLLAAGADPSKVYGAGAEEWEGASPLHRVVMMGGKGFGVGLLATPTNLRHMWKGQAPLHLAVAASKVNVVGALLKAGAAPGLLDEKNTTAMALAIKSSTTEVRKLLPAMVRRDCELYQQQQQAHPQQQQGQQQQKAQAQAQQQGQSQGNKVRDMAAVLGDARQALRTLLSNNQIPVAADCISAVMQVLGSAAASSLVQELMQSYTAVHADVYGLGDNEKLIKAVHHGWMAALQALFDRREQVACKLQRLVLLGPQQHLLLQPQQLGAEPQGGGGATAAAAAAGSNVESEPQGAADVCKGLHTQCLAAAEAGQWTVVADCLGQLAELEPGEPERFDRLKSVLTHVAGNQPLALLAQLVITVGKLSELSEALLAAWGVAQRDTAAHVQREMVDTVLAAVRAGAGDMQEGHVHHVACQPRRRRARRGGK